eukprot:gene15768-18744_t
MDSERARLEEISGRGRLEDERINGIVSYVISRGLTVLVHLQDMGDVHGGSSGVFIGTRGQSKRLEGFEITLGDSQHLYIQYMAHLQDKGDVEWQSGGFIGTRGQSRRLEGFALRLHGRGDGGQKLVSRIGIRYMAHLEGLGDTRYYENGEFCGTRGQSRRVEGIAVQLYLK